MNKRMLARNLFQAAGVFLLAAPAVLVLGEALLPGDPARWLLPLGGVLALAWFARLLPGRARLPLFLLGIGAGVFACLRREAGAAHVMMAAVLTLIGAGELLLLCGKLNPSFFPAAWYAGIGLYVFARILAAVARLTALVPALGLCALVYACYLFFAFMAGSLQEGIQDGRAPSRMMLLRNGSACTLLAAALLLLTHLPQCMRMLRKLAAMALAAVRWVMSLRLLPGDAASGGGGGGMDLSGFLGEKAAASPFWVLLEKILRAAAAVLALAVGAALLYLIGRSLVRAVRALWARLRAYAGAVSEAYEDTVESLLDWGQVQSALEKRREKAREKRESRVPWDRLPPRQKVRSSYRAFLIRHPEVPPQRTARKAIGNVRLARIYEAARYSSGEITAAQAEEMRTLETGKKENAS